MGKGLLGFVLVGLFLLAGCNGTVPPGSWPTGLLTCTAPPGRTPGRCAVRRTLALARSASAVPGGAGVAKLEAVGRLRPCCGMPVSYSP